MTDINIPEDTSDNESSLNDDPVENLSEEDDDDDDDDILDGTNEPDELELQEDDDLEANDTNQANKLDVLDNQNLLPNNLVNNITDLHDIDSEEFLQKFDNELKENYIVKHHPECLNKNINEIKKLAEVKKIDGIISDNFHKTIPFLTKFERTKIIGIRVKQLSLGAKPFISVSENILDNFIIASKELEEKKLPFIIERPIPNNTFEYWYLKDLELF